MKILIVLLTVLAIDLAKAHPQWGSGSGCYYSPGRGMICNNSGGLPSGGNSPYNIHDNIQAPSRYPQDNSQDNFQGQGVQVRGHCDNSTGTRRCTVERCTISQNGQRTCSTSTY